MGYGPATLWLIISNLAKVNSNQKLSVFYGLVTFVK